MRNFKKLTLLLIVLTLSACGFTMRGEVNIPPQIKKISVTSNEYSSLVNTLNTSLVKIYETIVCMVISREGLLHSYQAPWTI